MGWEEYFRAESLRRSVLKYKGNVLGERMRRDLIYNFVSPSFPWCMTQEVTGVSHSEITLNCEFTLNYMTVYSRTTSGN